MPNSVIATNLIDDILPAGDLVERIISHIRNPQQPKLTRDEKAYQDLDSDDPISLIFYYLTETAGVDFSEYKEATVNRRIERRMQVKHAQSLKDYAKLLKTDPSELSILRRELFIPVTRFFRDAEAFDDLQKMVVADLVKKADVNYGIRIWSAGISSGEEVYSIAMLFFEAFEKERRWPNLKIFATDVNPQAIELASAGHYPESIAAEVSAERLERYFVKSGNEYVVKPELRQVVVFAKHNLLSDPPFTRMDLVTCRNTLIYFKTEPQTRAMVRLRYAVKPDGYLFLGSSESISPIAKGFETIEAKSKLFKRNHLSLPIVGIDNDSTAYRNSSKPRKPYLNKPNDIETSEVVLLDEISNQMIEAYSPPGFLVNSHQEVIHLYGDINPFYTLRSGAATMEIARILPDKLISVVTALLFKAMKDQKVLYSDQLTLMQDNTPIVIRVCVRPIMMQNDEKFSLVLFEPIHQTNPEDARKKGDIGQEASARIEVLQEQLDATRESLQATIEELETSNEELQATNEELMASNEELQSSNEELQSVNEELNTVNAEYQEKVFLLNQLNVDLDAMAKAVGVATIFVDHNLNISRFSPDAVGLFKLRDADIGRPLSDLHHSFDNEHLIDYFEETLKTTRPFETDLIHQNKKSYLLRILPYQMPSSDKHGAVASFIDVTAVNDGKRLQATIDALPEHIAVLSPTGEIKLFNQAWSRFAKANGDPDLVSSGIGANYLEACKNGLHLTSESPSTDDSEDEITAKQAYLGLKSVLEGTETRFSLVYPCHSPDEQRWFVMNVSQIPNQNDFAVVVSHSNISVWYQQNKVVGNKTSQNKANPIK